MFLLEFEIVWSLTFVSHIWAGGCQFHGFSEEHQESIKYQELLFWSGLCNPYDIFLFVVVSIYSSAFDKIMHKNCNCFIDVLGLRFLLHFHFTSSIFPSRSLCVCSRNMLVCSLNLLFSHFQCTFLHTNTYTRHGDIHAHGMCVCRVIEEWINKYKTPSNTMSNEQQ